MEECEKQFIEVGIANELSECVVTDHQVIDETIHGYVDMVVRALEGVTFHRKTIYQGFKQWCSAYEESLE